jgi:hypothetical protein
VSGYRSSNPLPTEAQFNLKGYSQLPDGMATDDPRYMAHADYPPGLGAPQWDVEHLGQANLAWLADVRPGGLTFTFPAMQLRPLI